MGKIYVIRHAQAEGNLYRRVHGWYDSDLTYLGRQQVKLLEERFRHVEINAVYSSDLRRARTTASSLCEPRNLTLHLEQGLREIHMGTYEDVPIGEMEYLHPAEYQLFRARSPHWQAPDGETFQQVKERMTECFFRLAQAHQTETIALFSHKAALHTLQAALHNLPPHEFSVIAQQNTSVSCYEIQGGKFRILFENDTSHLPPAVQKAPIPKVRFRPVLWKEDEALYRTARREAWLMSHADLLHFNGPAYLEEAREQTLWDPRAVQIALLDREPVGILQLATLDGAQAGVGRIPLLWVQEAHRRNGIGVQLLGQTISLYRAMGRSCVRLQCSPKNSRAQAFYQKYGFRKIGETPGLQNTLDLLERPI